MNGSTHTLAKYEAARTALAAAHRIDEVKEIRDKAQAMSAYARQARDTQLIQWATEIKVRAERRAGEMLATVERSNGGRGIIGPSVAQVYRDNDIAPTTGKRWQKLAAVPEDKFEQAVAAAKEVAGEVTTAHMLRLSDELRKNRDLETALERARAEIDPESRADAVWRPFELALNSMLTKIVEIGKAGDPPCPPLRAARMLSLWATISEFLSVNLERKWKP